MFLTFSHSQPSVIIVNEAGCFHERNDMTLKRSNLQLNAIKMSYKICLMSKRRHDTQHNDIQHNDTHHNDIQHNDTQHKRLISDNQRK